MLESELDFASQAMGYAAGPIAMMKTAAEDAVPLAGTRPIRSVLC